MKKTVMIAAIIAAAVTAASADYISYFGQTDMGLGYYRYDYRYINPGGADDLVQGSTTWTLSNIVGLNDPFANAAGAVYWNDGTFVNNNTGVMWTYLGTDGGGPDDTGQESYGLFQVVVYHPGGHTSDVPYEITQPDEGGNVPGPTPEPATISLCLLGLGALVARRRYAA